MITFLFHPSSDAHHHLSPVPISGTSRTMMLGHLAIEARGTTRTLCCALQTSHRIEPPPWGCLAPQPPPRATSPNICSRGQAPRDAHPWKQMQNRTARSPNVGLKIELDNSSMSSLQYTPQIQPLSLLSPSPHPHQNPSAHCLVPSRGAHARVCVCIFFS